MAARKTSYLYAILGITLVLFVAGIGGAVIIEANRFTNQFRDNIAVEVVLKTDMSSSDLNATNNLIKKKQFVKSVKFISKEEAAKTLEQELGSNYLDVLGYNPLYNSFIVTVSSDFTTKEFLEKAKEELMALQGVEQVNMQIEIIDSINKRIRTFSLAVVILSTILTSIAVSLIFSTVRLAVFTNRFIIKTEQMFGATRWFIVKPYLVRGILNGLLGGLLSVLLVTGVLFYMNYTMPDLALEKDLISFAFLASILIVSGTLISLLSTLLAVSRYLKMKLDELY